MGSDKYSEDVPMVTALVLVIGVVVVLIVGSILLAVMGYAYILPALIPIAPGLVLLGSFLLALTEIISLFGGRENRRIAARHYCYLFPIMIVSGILFYLAQKMLWG